jgi:hypothetical protein
MSVGFIGVSDAQSLFVYVVITALPFPWTWNICRFY